MGVINTLILAIEASQMAAGAARAARAADEVSRAARATAGQVDRLQDSLERSSSAISGTVNAIRAMAAALVGFVSLRSVVNTLSDFEQSVRNIGATSNASAAQLGLIGSSIKDLNQTTKFNLTEIEASLLSVSRAGFSLRDSLVIVPNALNLAAASFGDVGSAADVTADVLKSFNLEVKESGRVADVLANLANVTSAEITEIKDAIATVAPVAAQFGISLEEVAAGIATLTERGLRARIGALGLKEVLIQLGPALDKSNPDRVGLTQALEKLAARQFTASEQTAIFSKEVVQVSTTLLNNVDRYKQLIEIAGKAGGATEIVADQQKTLEFAMKRAGAAGLELVIAFGEQGLTAAIKKMLFTLADATLIVSGNEKAMYGASDAAHEMAKVLNTALSVTIATAAGLATAAIAAFAAAVYSALGPVGSLVGIVGALIAAWSASKGEVDDVAESFRRLNDATVDIRLVPQNIDSQLEKLSRAAAIVKIASETGNKGGLESGRASQLKLLRDLEAELEIIQAQGRYTATSIMELADALGTTSDVLLQRSWIKEAVAGMSQLYTSAKKTNEIDWSATREALRGLMEGLSASEFDEFASNFERLKAKAESLNVLKFKFVATVDQDSLTGKKLIQNDVVAKLVKDEIRILQNQLKADSEAKLEMPDIEVPKDFGTKAANAITKTIDELIAKFGQRAKNAGNINVLTEIIKKLQDETTELQGNTLERAQNKAVIDARNFAIQQGVELSKDEIEIIKQEVAAQEDLRVAYQKAQDLVRIQREKTEEAEDLIRAIKLEADTLNLSNEERERTATYRRADEIAAKGQSAAITELTNKIKDEADQLAKLRVYQEIGDAISSPMTQALEDMLLNLKSFKEAAEATFREITQGLLRAMVIRPAQQMLTGAITNLLSSFAGGTGSGDNQWTANSPGPATETIAPNGGFAPGWNLGAHALGDTFSGGYGKVFSSPTFFGTPSNTAVNMLGENGTEGAFPLTKDRQGRLAIRSDGSGGSTVINTTVVVKAENPAEFGRSRRQVIDSARAITRGTIR